MDAESTSTNPYQPPGLRAGRRRGRPWYDGPPADWERTASMGWIAAVAGFWIAGSITFPPDPATPIAVPQFIPGPAMLGVFGYALFALLLALVPAAICGVLHFMAMRLSGHPLYRRALNVIASVGCVVLAALVCGFGSLLIIR